MLEFLPDVLNMTLLFLVAKVFIVVFFLIMFLRSDKLVWGIGLLTVTSAILLDTLMATFGREEMLELLGFFFYVIAGALFAGGAIWFFTLIRPYLRTSEPARVVQGSTTVLQTSSNVQDIGQDEDGTAIDRQILYDQMRHNLSPDDILDLVYDMGWPENEVIAFNQDPNQLIVNIIDLAEERRQTGSLALAVERILTPIPADNLPRLEKLNADSPRPVLRYHLLANYTTDELEEMATDLDVDWEIIGGDNKKTKVRNFLLYLYRRNRIQDLIGQMQDGDVTEEE
ncbi:MAG: hypothetical protein PVH03_04615 [Chloroflexota bacterium]|jgi:hypothetical protein